MKQINTNKKQKGFSILAVILVIVAVIVAIGVWALSGQTNTSSTGQSTNDIQSAAIINDGASIKLAFDTLITNGTSANNITFMPNISSSTNMLDPMNGIKVPIANKKALFDDQPVNPPYGLWIYNNNFKGNSIGDITKPSKVILLTGIKDSVCSRINQTLHGSTDVPPAGFPIMETAITGASLINPNSVTEINLNTSPYAAPTAGWTAGCVATSNNDTKFSNFNVYYNILKIN